MITGHVLYCERPVDRQASNKSSYLHHTGANIRLARSLRHRIRPGENALALTHQPLGTFPSIGNSVKHITYRVQLSRVLRWMRLGAPKTLVRDRSCMRRDIKITNNVLSPTPPAGSHASSRPTLPRHLFSSGCRGFLHPESSGRRATGHAMILCRRAWGVFSSSGMCMPMCWLQKEFVATRNKMLRWRQTPQTHICSIYSNPTGFPIFQILNGSDDASSK